MKHFLIVSFYIFGVLLSTANSDEECHSAAHSEVTLVTSERIVYEWKIKNFNLLTQGNGEAVYSEQFHSKNCKEKWRLDLFPHGSEGHDGYISLYLTRASASTLPIEIYTELAILKSNEIVENMSFIRTYDTKVRWGYPEFMERSRLLRTDSPDQNEIVIRCTIKLPSETVISTYNATILDSKETLVNDFRSLFKEPVFTDFRIIVGDKEFPTHKAILASRSPVFAAMFDRNMTEENPESELEIENVEPTAVRTMRRENIERKLLIENVEPAVINGMLEFIYTDQVSDIKNLASDLLVMADRYELDGLKIECEKALYDGLSSENATDILIFAEQHHANKLKSLVIQYIVEHAHEVLDSENFKMAELSSELLKELMRKLIR